MRHLETVESCETFQKYIHSQKDMDDQCKMLKSEMDKVLQRCTNQHQISKKRLHRKTFKNRNHAIWLFNQNGI